MSAIKLPVRAERLPMTIGWWVVKDAHGVCIAKTGGSEHLAREIAHAQNALPRLVEALRFYARHGSDMPNVFDPSKPGNTNDWNRIITSDGGDVARAALALAESKP